jgi:hypothetical protein
MIQAKEIDGELWIKAADFHKAIKDAQRLWVGLTDDERNEIASVTFGRENALALYVDAIEAKLKEKNNAA